MFTKIPGTKDILPDETGTWQTIEAHARSIFALHNYREIRTPVIESINLFDRSLGQTAEIVQKQMFVIKNQEDTYVLRPEGTASVVRAYLENSLDKTKKFSKLFYIGPMFRFERPQKGRQRQFHHIGAEAIGSDSPYLDAELISLAQDILKKAGVKSFVIHINSLGCSDDKQKFAQYLKDKLQPRTHELCEDCKVRFERNVLRILDCKNKSCQDIVHSVNLSHEYLCSDCSNHFSSVCSALDQLGIAYQINLKLVRGLDYYTKTVFEITSDKLGSQDAIAAGGRYDNLVNELGGEKIPAAGFACGFERILLARELPPENNVQIPVYLIGLDPESKKKTFLLMQEIRAQGIACETDYENKSLKASLRSANDLGSQFVVIIGENELQKQCAMVKDMRASSQSEIGYAQLIPWLQERL